jgi:hypothetical protein
LARNPNTETSQDFPGPGEGCEGWEGFSTPHTRAQARARMMQEGAGRPSQPYRPSPSPCATGLSAGEGSEATLTTLPSPSWLDGVP